MVINQKEIAKRAGVSRATVSRAFTQSANISPKTLAKIQDAMVSLGLEPIAWLANGELRRVRYVLVIAGDISNHFYSQIIRGVCDQLSSLGIMTVVCNSGYDSQIEEEQIEFANANHYLGIIMVTAIERPTLSDVLMKSRVPIVFVNRYIHSVDTDVVCIDNYMGGYMAATYLTGNGHRRVGYVATYKGSTPQEDRIKGFSAALQDMRITLERFKVFYGKSSVLRGKQTGEEFAAQGMPYTALFVADALVAVGIANSLRDKGLRIPEDVSILCFDDSPYIDESGLDLSTIQYDPYAMGQTTANTLIQRMNTPNNDVHHIYLVPKLVERKSVRKLAGD